MLDKESGIQKRDCEGYKHLVVISDKDIHLLVIRRYSDSETEWKLPREWVQRDIQVLGPWARSWDEEKIVKETEKETTQKKKGMISADSLKLKMGFDWFQYGGYWRPWNMLFQWSVLDQCLIGVGLRENGGKREYRQFFQGILL